MKRDAFDGKYFKNNSGQSLPGLGPALLLQRSQPLPDDGEFGRVDHFGFSTAVGELQRAVPLALRFAHNGVGGVVFDLRSHPAALKQDDDLSFRNQTFSLRDLKEIINYLLTA